MAAFTSRRVSNESTCLRALQKRGVIVFYFTLILASAASFIYGIVEAFRSHSDREVEILLSRTRIANLNGPPLEPISAVVQVETLTNNSSSLSSSLSSSSLASIRKETYMEKFLRLTEADPSKPTLAYAPGHFFSGLCNEVITFTAFLMYAYDNNFTQVFLPSLKWKDVFGTRRSIPHEILFDVVYWNELVASLSAAQQNNESYKAPLPRLVRYHPSMIHVAESGVWLVNHRNATLPYAAGRQPQLFPEYKKYTGMVGTKRRARHPSDLAILKRALRPHPDFQSIIVDYKTSLLSKSLSSTSLSPPATTTTYQKGYICLHARVEPDMQKHRPCKQHKETSLEKIINDIYERFPVPPYNQVLIILNRELLEKEDLKENELAAQNLALLNQIRRDGMWNGTVPVYEAGTGTLPRESFYAQSAPSISGAILNYELALDSDLFIGTWISSYAMQIMATRYHRNQKENYLYGKRGVKKVDPANEPPPFSC
ncbi:hypothetical protein ACA910_021848 [Epithemia clementina (nom. ined.)]